VVDKDDTFIPMEAKQEDTITVIEDKKKMKTTQVERRSERLKREIHITTQEKMEAMAKKRCLEGNPNKTSTLNDVSSDQLHSIAKNMGVIVADDNFAIINLIKDIETARNYLYSKQLQVSVSVTEEAPQEFSEQQYAYVFPRKKEKCKQEKFKISPEGESKTRKILACIFRYQGTKRSL